jgi:uncharacterized protein (TIGR01777 family)
MKFFIMGGTGFTGSPLIRHLLKKGHEVTALVRSAAKAGNLPPGTNLIEGNPLEAGQWQKEAARAGVIVNLVGKPIMTRWTRTARREITKTRVISTRMAVQAIPEKQVHGIVLINANAAGYYGFTKDDVITEESPAGKGFLAEVAKSWQEEAEVAGEKGARVVIARLGAIIGREGGALAQMLPSFQYGLGGRLGSGRQWFPWMHIHDLCRAILFVAVKTEISGAVNMCSPNPVTNIELTRTLARKLKRPAILPVPGFMLKLAVGGAAEIALEGQRMIPGILEKQGFDFGFPTLEEALRDLLGKRG